ncbi:MAG: cupin domain-containing protein [Sphingomonadaceae bacterium]|nr:cupin domain-containing protein [Sphingomonadaceae bacterium]
MQLRTRIVALSLAASALVAPALACAADKPVIVLIGAREQGYPAGEHDFPDGVLKLERLIKASAAFADAKAVVRSYPVGFPKNLTEIDDASVVVLYLGVTKGPDGRRSPLQEPAVKAELGKLMARGVGLVALHQAFTLPEKSADLPLADWLGGVRVDTDRTTEIAPVTVAAKGHPVARGLGAFETLDEFYPTISFGHTTRVTPILNAHIHTQYANGKPTFADPAENAVVAWANERADGGRAFGYAGLHYLLALDDPQVRKLLLNAILWTAKGDVPPGGVTAPSIPVLTKDGHLPQPEQRYLLTASEAKPEAQPWGELVWYASRALGNSTHVTTGQATIRAGQSNPAHWHPNCDEVLHVLQGRIMNRIGDKEFEMKAGDTVVIPEGIVHNAHNIGTEDAVLSIAYNSADRVAIGEN